ncbi:MAG: hypothetical protein QOI31_1137 [Solirubrobacterales bacterium]|jgi:hypothetical protein|nr:hypothetical protein [Solirubrobacterales bacterium]
MEHLRQKLTYSRVVSTLALFVALGGTAYAAVELQRDDVRSKHIKNGQVKGEDLADNSVTSPKVANGSLLGEDFAAGQLEQEFAQFYALMPPNNAATVAPGAAVSFPQDGPASGDITRASADNFVLAEVGTYRVDFIVSVSEAGQLALRLDGNQLNYTVFGRATGTSQIVGEALVTTTTPNSTISVVNPAGNSTALTITPLAGGTAPVAASLVIQQLR